MGRILSLSAHSDVRSEVRVPVPVLPHDAHCVRGTWDRFNPPVEATGFPDVPEGSDGLPEDFNPQVSRFARGRYIGWSDRHGRHVFQGIPVGGGEELLFAVEFTGGSLMTRDENQGN